MYHSITTYNNKQTSEILILIEKVSLIVNYSKEALYVPVTGVFV